MGFLRSIFGKFDEETKNYNFEGLDPNDKNFGNKILFFLNDELKDYLKISVKTTWITSRDKLPLVIIQRGVDKIDERANIKINSFYFQFFCNNQELSDSITKRCFNKVNDLFQDYKKYSQVTIEISEPIILNIDERNSVFGTVFRTAFNMLLRSKIEIKKRQISDKANIDKTPQRNGILNVVTDKINMGLTLNKEQIKAIQTERGNLLIIASAGTGKTTTIVERYVYLIKNSNLKPTDVMMTTFTIKAAEDMKKKILLRGVALPDYIGTIHSLFLRILNNHTDILLNKNFTIIDESDKKKMLKLILKNMDIETNGNNLKYFLTKISQFKNLGITADYLNTERILEDDKEKLEEIAIDDEAIWISNNIKRSVNRVYKHYQESLKKENLIDLDDILLLTFQLFEKNQKIKESYVKRFKSIMVDEAQDLNNVQMKILELISKDNLCLIGDDCQNIYEWRGSSNDLVFKFNKHYNTITLKNNYRSTEKIINAINKIIDTMHFKIPKDLKCTRERGEDIIVKSFSSLEEEKDYIIDNIKGLIKNGVKYNDIAVLFRTTKPIGRILEEELLKANIPCHLSRSKRFLEREEVKDILSFIKLKVNNNALMYFGRLLLLFEGFGKAKLKKIEEMSVAHGCSPVECINFLSELRLSGSQVVKLKGFGETLNDFKSNPVDLFVDFFSYEKILNRKYHDDGDKVSDKLGNINVLREIIREYEYTPEGLKCFLDNLIDLDKKEKYDNKIILSTIHSAKGLEWGYTFLARCNEGILPFYRGELSRNKRDEELRLFYVAVSRAKNRLIITYSESDGFYDLYPSQFLDVID